MPVPSSVYVYTADEIDKLIAIERRIARDQALEDAADMIEQSYYPIPHKIAEDIRALITRPALPNGKGDYPDPADRWEGWPDPPPRS